MSDVPLERFGHPFETLAALSSAAKRTSGATLMDSVPTLDCFAALPRTKALTVLAVVAAEA